MIKKIKTAASAALALLRGEPIKAQQDLLQVCSEVAKNQILRDAKKTERDAAVKIAADDFDAALVEYEQHIDAGTRRIRAWAEQNREAFGNRKSFVIGQHVLEFRSNGGAVATIGNAKEKDVAEHILNLPVPDDFTADEIAAMPPEVLEDLNANQDMKEQLLRPSVALNKDAVERWFRMSSSQPERRRHLERVKLTFEETENFIFTPAREENADIAVKMPAAAKKEAA